MDRSPGSKTRSPGANDLSPVSLDVGGVVAPSRSESLAAHGFCKRQVQVGNCPDAHSAEIKVACRLADERIRSLLFADRRGAAVARIDDGIVGELEKFGANAAE